MQKTSNTYIGHALMATLILAFEAWIGIGIIGMAVGMIGALVAVLRAMARKEQRSSLLKVTAVYALLFVATVGIIESNWRVAQRRAEPVIAAIDRFHTDRNRYPDSLTELVPTYLPTIPSAGYTRWGSDFYYIRNRPQLYFAVMFHGNSGYDFSTRNWTTNE